MLIFIFVWTLIPYAILYLQACIPKEVVKNSRTLFQTLKDELTQRARMKGCYSDVQEVVSLQEAKAVLYKLTDLVRILLLFLFKR